MRSLNKGSLLELDSIGASVSGLCLVHCIAMPLVLAFSPTLAHLVPGDELIHRGLALLVVGAGLPSFLAGYRRHRKWRAPATGFAGMAVVLGALAFGDRFSSHFAEVTVTSAGSLLLSTAHLANRTFCKKCERCDH